LLTQRYVSIEASEGTSFDDSYLNLNISTSLLLEHYTVYNYCVGSKRIIYKNCDNSQDKPPTKKRGYQDAHTKISSETYHSASIDDKHISSNIENEGLRPAK
jgi:hypothetical protein